ncbi:MAG TPA: RNA polymerase sigma factor [Polyangiaceae bacterium]|nr:RNA polymerase sigma factor [Polyangiaceae bacterium]
MPRAPAPAKSVPGDLLALLPRACAGEPAAVNELLAQSLPPMLRVVRQVLGRYHDDVEDVVQEAAFGLMEALPSFRAECTLGHFARRVALLTALNARRRFQLRERLTPSAVPAELDVLGREELSPTHGLEERRRQAVLRLLNELPQAQAETLAMHCVLGFTVAEIAEATGVVSNTVRSRLVSAKQTLRAVLADDTELEAQLRDWSRGAG